MLKDARNIFSRKQKAIQEEIALKLKIDKTLAEFIKTEILKKADMNYKSSYTVTKGIIKINTDNKLIAQEIALRIRILEKKLKENGAIFKRLLI